MKTSHPNVIEITNELDDQAAMPFGSFERFGRR
jgi:hypothetical protein